MTDAPNFPADKARQQALEQALAEAIQAHLQAARLRVPNVYRSRFASSAAILKRHWVHRRDIPADLLSLPRSLWRQGQRLTRSKPIPDAPSLSRKEQALLQILQLELLDLPGLQLTLQGHLRQHSEAYAACDDLLHDQAPGNRLPEIERFLQQHLERLSMPREGTRDLLVFMLIGSVGHGLGQKVTFGSALATGSAVATSAYLASQSWWGALWVQMTGIPAWVTLGGAVSGAAAALVLTPLVAPLGDMLVNRWRGERYLLGIIDRIEQNLLQSQADGLDFAGQLASLTQFAPDLLTLLKTLH
jgi:hypothetical protein